MTAAISAVRGQDWQRDRTLDARQLDAVARAIAESGIDDDGERCELLLDDGNAPPVLWVQIARPRGTKTVAMVGTCRMSGVEKLTEALLWLFRGENAK